MEYLASFILETKISLNSVVSDAKCTSFDIKYVFLANPMDKPEYMKLMWKNITEDIQKKYNLYNKKAHYGCVFIQIKKGMYSLKQAAVLLFTNLVTNLSKAGY